MLLPFLASWRRTPHTSHGASIADIMGGLGIGMASTLAEPGPSRALESDEFEEVFEDGAIGMELEDVRENEAVTVNPLTP